MPKEYIYRGDGMGWYGIEGGLVDLVSDFRVWLFSI